MHISSNIFSIKTYKQIHYKQNFILNSMIIFEDILKVNVCKGAVKCTKVNTENRRLGFTPVSYVNDARGLLSFILRDNS